VCWQTHPSESAFVVTLAFTKRKEILMQLFSKIRIVLLTLLLTLFMVACGSAEEPAPEPPPAVAPAEVSEPEAAEESTDTPEEPTATVEPTAEPTPEPTATSEPTATAEPTPEPAADLSGLAADFVPYESAFAGLALAHPADWVFEDFFFTIFASDAELLEAAMEDDDLPDDLDGRVFGLLLSLSAEEADVSSAEEMLDQALEEFEMTEGEGEILEGPVEMDFNGQPGMYLVVAAEEDGVEVAILYLTIFNEELERTAVMIGFTSPAGMDEFLPVLLAMADTIEMVEPDMESLFDFDFDLDGEDMDGFEMDVALAAPGHRLILEETVAEGDEHHYYFIATDRGRLTAVVTPLGDLDVVLEIYDENDELLLEVDEDFGEETISFSSTDEEPAFYTLVVRGYADQGGDYLIDLEANEGIILYLVDGDEVFGLLGDDSWLEYAVVLDEGETITVVVSPEAGFDVMVDIYDVDDVLLENVDSGFSGEPETLSFTAPADGVYFLVVQGFIGDVGQYLLSITLEE
jgi:hypothetical protein